LVSDSNGGNGAGRLLNDRYQLISVVGGGGMAQVYKARDNILGRIVAVKVLREQYASDAQFVARFRREAQAAANLSHPNIVNVYDVGQDGDMYYIIMEYIAGTSVKELITQSAPLPIDQAVSIAAQILAGLEYAHRNGLIHRDIKPQNVLITPEGGVKVTDFGIAKSVSDLGLTEAGLALGTAHYFSPEQARGERVVPQSDIYAVGVTLYEMLTGRLPFESESAVGLAYKHIGEPPPPPRDLVPSIPPRLNNIVLRALAKDPQDRFTSAAEMEKALRAVQAGGQQPTVEVPIARTSVTQPRSRPSGKSSRAPRATTSPVTGPVRPSGVPRGVYPSAGGAAAATRQITSPIGSPASMAIRPAPVRVQSASGGCSAIAIGIGVFGLIAILLVGAIWAGPQLSGILPNIFSNYVVPSPTITPIIPTSTPTNTPIPPSPTPTYTPTITPTPTPTPRSAPVPQLVGLKLQDATVLAKQRGFVLLELERVVSQYEEGVVIQQDPPANTIFKQTSQIAVRVSSGPPPFKLPELANTDPDTARATLETAGLKVELAYEGSQTVLKGVVTRTEPIGGANVRPGDTIKLYISLGEVIAVPDLFGVESLEVATQRLGALGLNVGTVTEVDDPEGRVPPGAVLGQDPPKGTLLEKGAPVNLQLRKK
jgi:serine/threonine protein kinase